MHYAGFSQEMKYRLPLSHYLWSTRSVWWCLSLQRHILCLYFLILFVYCCARYISGIINDLHNRFLVIKSLGVFKKIKANKQKIYETNKYTWTYFKINFNNFFNVKYIFVFTFKFWSCHMYSSFIELWSTAKCSSSYMNLHLHAYKSQWNKNCSVNIFLI